MSDFCPLSVLLWKHWPYFWSSRLFLILVPGATNVPACLSLSLTVCGFPFTSAYNVLGLQVTAALHTISTKGRGLRKTSPVSWGDKPLHFSVLRGSPT